MLLLQRQADFHARNGDQQTPLHVSASAGFGLKSDVLVNLRGAQLDARDINSKTPLEVAVEAEYTDIVQLLFGRMKLKTKNTTFLAALFSFIEI